MAATAACMHNAEMAGFYGRLVERGKPRKVALTAVMRKLIVTANALLRGRRMSEDRTEADAAAWRPDGPRRPGPERTMRAGHDTVAGLLRRARMAVRMWTACGKPGSGSPMTVKRDQVRA